MFSWELQPSEQGPVFLLVGCIDERAELQSMTEHIAAVSFFDFAKVERFNSSGIMRWFEFYESIQPRVEEIHFTHCSVSVVNHLNMIRNFAPGVWIDSFYAPYFCEECAHGEDHLVDIGEHRALLDACQAPTSTCSHCDREMVFDSLEATYFIFLNEASLRFPGGQT